MSTATKAKPTKRNAARVANVKPKVRLSDSYPVVRGRYDAAQTTTDNTNHWSAADSLTAAEALTPQVRTTLRDRSRYEVANNGFARGSVQTLVNYVVGTGPRLQVQTEDRDFNRRYEAAFRAWAHRVRLARKLRLLCMGEVVDGEAFALLATNIPLRHEVKLDIRPIEPERIQAPFIGYEDDGDGIVYDDFGNPMAYQVVRPSSYGLATDFDTYKAADVLHLFRDERVGQRRGIPRLTSTLSLFANHRRYRLATLAAAETAADLAGIIRTQNFAADPDELEPLDAVEIERRTLMTLPAGWDISQLRAEQPTTTYGDFSDHLLGESARPLDMPFNIAAAKSAGYNFASAKLDLLLFAKAVGIEQDHVEQEALEPILERWHAEARMISGLFGGADESVPPHEWYWDQQDTLDPREAGANATKLANGMMSLPEYYGRRGLDWEEQQEAAAEALGLSIEEYRARLRDKLFGAAAPTNNGESDADAEDE